MPDFLIITGAHNTTFSLAKLVFGVKNHDRDEDDNTRSLLYQLESLSSGNHPKK